MTNASYSLMDRLAALIAGGSPVEVSLSAAEAEMAGLFDEDAMTADEAEESMTSGEASRG